VVDATVSEITFSKAKGMPLVDLLVETSVPEATAYVSHMFLFPFFILSQTRKFCNFQAIKNI